MLSSEGILKKILLLILYSLPKSCRPACSAASPLPLCSRYSLQANMFYCLPLSPPKSCRPACSASTLSVPGTVCTSPADQRVLQPPSQSLAQSARVLQTSVFCCHPLCPWYSLPSPALQHVLLPPSQSLVQSADQHVFFLPPSPWYSLPKSFRTPCSAATLSVPGTVCPSPADQRVLLPPSHSLVQLPKSCRTACSTATLSVPGTVCPGIADQHVLLPPPSISVHGTVCLGPADQHFLLPPPGTVCTSLQTRMFFCPTPHSQFVVQSTSVLPPSQSRV